MKGMATKVYLLGTYTTSMMELFRKNSERLIAVNPLSAKPTIWSNTLKQLVGVGA